MIEYIQDFLARRRIAIVGVSHDPKKFSRIVYRAFRERGYDVVPVNPNVRVVEEQYCFPRLQDVEPPAEAVLIMTPTASEQVAQDCVAAGVRRIWLYKKSPSAEALCAAAGIPVVAGECPMMYLEGAGLIHRIHRWFHASAML